MYFHLNTRKNESKPNIKIKVGHSSKDKKRAKTPSKRVIIGGRNLEVEGEIARK